MIVSATSLPILPEALIFLKIINRSRVRITVIEITHLVRDIADERKLCCQLAHGFTTRLILEIASAARAHYFYAPAQPADIRIGSSPRVSNLHTIRMTPSRPRRGRNLHSRVHPSNATMHHAFLARAAAHGLATDCR